MKKISMLIAVAATCISSMQAIYVVNENDGNLIWYASCSELISHPEKFDTSSDRFYRAFEECQWYTLPEYKDRLEELIFKKRVEIAQNNPRLKDVDHLKLKPLVKRHVICTLAGKGQIATNSICSENEKNLQDFLNAVNATNN